MHPNVESMVLVTVTKKIEIIMIIQVYLISWMNFHYWENGGKKSFSCKSKASKSNVANMIVVPITERMEIIIGIQVYVISRMNFNYKENNATKSFPSKSIASISCIPMWKT